MQVPGGPIRDACEFSEPYSESSERCTSIHFVVYHFKTLNQRLPNISIKAYITIFTSKITSKHTV